MQGKDSGRREATVAMAVPVKFSLGKVLFCGRCGDTLFENYRVENYQLSKAHKLHSVFSPPSPSPSLKKIFFFFNGQKVLFTTRCSNQQEVVKKRILPCFGCVRGTQMKCYVIAAEALTDTVQDNVTRLKSS